MRYTACELTDRLELLGLKELLLQCVALFPGLGQAQTFLLQATCQALNDVDDQRGDHEAGDRTGDQVVTGDFATEEDAEHDDDGGGEHLACEDRQQQDSQGREFVEP